MRVITKWIDAINHHIGRGIAWLVLAMVLVQFTTVILRYVFGIGFIFLQESVIYMHGILFMLAAAYTFLHDGHVRIDIFYSRMTPAQQAAINFGGCVFLVIPFCVLIWFASFDYVALSWSVREGSRETSGLPAIYLLKSVILLFAVQLGLQAISQFLKAWKIINTT